MGGSRIHISTFGGLTPREKEVRRVFVEMGVRVCPISTTGCSFYPGSFEDGTCTGARECVEGDVNEVSTEWRRLMADNRAA